MKRVALYIRVSTSKQDTENQRRELEAVADRSGWKIVKVYEDCAVRIYANAASIIQLGGVVVPVLSGSEQYSSAPDKRPTPIAELTGYSCRKGAV